MWSSMKIKLPCFRHLLPQLGKEIKELENQAKKHWNEGAIEASLESWRKMGQKAETIVKNPSKLLILVRETIMEQKFVISFCD